MNFTAALAQHDVRLASDADPIVDDTGHDYDRFIPADRVEEVIEDVCLHHEVEDHMRLEFGRFFVTTSCVECGEVV